MKYKIVIYLTYLGGREAAGGSAPTPLPSRIKYMKFMYLIYSDYMFMSSILHVFGTSLICNHLDYITIAMYPPPSVNRPPFFPLSYPCQVCLDERNKLCHYGRCDGEVNRWVVCCSHFAFGAPTDFKGKTKKHEFQAIILTDKTIVLIKAPSTFHTQKHNFGQGTLHSQQSKILGGCSCYPNQSTQVVKKWQVLIWNTHVYQPEYSDRLCFYNNRPVNLETPYTFSHT